MVLGVVFYCECGTGSVGRGKMSRPIMLVFLLVILIVTSQFEWRQPLLELDAAPSLSQKHQQIAKREDAVKEKVSLFSWKNSSSCICITEHFWINQSLDFLSFLSAFILGIERFIIFTKL